ncbi:MAG TPA: membrane dipeptidase [Anaerolineales bacterium]|nr:membrane dipeptidase [Anaerolineales bacterium]
MTDHLIVDAHEDLAYNILNFGRDYTRSVVESRQVEQTSNPEAPEHAGETLLGWPEYQRGRVAVVFGTLFATPARRKEGDWDRQSYADFAEAHRIYRAQLDEYHRLTDDHPDRFRLIGARPDLEAILADWADASRTEHPVGLVPLMEGADGLGGPSELGEWWDAGLRLIGLAWAGTRYCGGTRDPGPLTDEGRELIRAMADFGFTLDLSHMDPLSARESLDLYPGPVIASHSNAASLLPGYDGNRLLPEDVIRGLIGRGAVIGIIPYCTFLSTGWRRGDRREGITLETVAAQIDHICQLAGDALHVGLGSDFDGGFGLDSVPTGVDSISDLQKLDPILKAKGYNDEAIAAVLGENWLRHLRATLPT